MTVSRGSNSQTRNKVMTPEQFKQVVEAITEGRYSWACVLILRFAGYNPVHFIPHRTYSRLLKESRMLHATESTTQNSASRCPTQIKDLAYVEVIESQESSPHGGSFPQWFTGLFQSRS
ncbi:MAG: heterocyst differentiation protein [Leptolyngbya sp. ERB_1_1]